MSIWLIRAGARGEYEQKFIRENRVYVTWDHLSQNLLKLSNRKALFSALEKIYPDAKPKRILNWSSQIWPFAHEIKKGDLVILPLKTQPAVNIGEITSDYNFEPSGPNPFFHWRKVKWIGEAIPRTHFGDDILNTFGAFLTICRVKENNAESRILAMRASNWKAESFKSILTSPDLINPENIGRVVSDLEETARDQITRLINARFKNHGLTELVEAILKAQGYTTYRSPEGADGGADILAGGAPHGFGSPRLCVEVKSESSPIDRPTIDKLMGAVSKFGADEGLFVAWGGFKSNVEKEMAPSFFKVRLWNRDDLLTQLFANYNKLDEEIKARLPLKQTWVVANPEEIQEEE